MFDSESCYYGYRLPRRAEFYDDPDVHLSTGPELRFFTHIGTTDHTPWFLWSGDRDGPHFIFVDGSPSRTLSSTRSGRGRGGTSSSPLNPCLRHADGLGEGRLRTRDSALQGSYPGPGTSPPGVGTREGRQPSGATGDGLGERREVDTTIIWTVSEGRDRGRR